MNAKNTAQSFQFSQPQLAAGKSLAGSTVDRAPGFRRLFLRGRCMGYTRHSVATLRGIAATYRSLYSVGKIELNALRIMVAAHRKDVGRGSATDIALHRHLDRLRSEVGFYHDVWHCAAKASREKVCKPEQPIQVKMTPPCRPPSLFRVRKRVRG